MISSPPTLVLWVSTCAALLVMIGRAGCTGRARAWLWLMGLCGVELLTGVLLAAVHNNYAAYFYVFWAGLFLQAALRVGVIAEICCSFPGCALIGPRVRLAAGTASVIAAAGSWALAARGGVPWVEHLEGHQPWAAHMMAAVLLYDRCVSISILTFMTAVLACILLSGLAWDPLGAAIACGLGIRVGASALSGLLFSEDTKTLRLTGDYLEQVSHLAVILLWSHAFSSPAHSIAGPSAGLPTTGGGSPKAPTTSKAEQ